MRDLTKAESKIADRVRAGETLMGQWESRQQNGGKAFYHWWFRGVPQERLHSATLNRMKRDGLLVEDESMTRMVATYRWTAYKLADTPDFSLPPELERALRTLIDIATRNDLTAALSTADRFKLRQTLERLSTYVKE